LLNINPKLRTELSKALKFTTIIEDEEIILSTIKKDKIVKTKHVETTVYLDSCSSINMITKTFMINNKIPFKPISAIKETLYQACTNTTLISKLYEIEITIGNITSKEIFRLVEKDDIFQVLIGVDALARMKIIMDFSDHTLYQKTDEIRKIGSFESVTEIEDEEDDIKDEFEEELNKDVLVDYLLTTEDKYIQILYEEYNNNNDIDNSFGNYDDKDGNNFCNINDNINKNDNYLKNVFECKINNDIISKVYNYNCSSYKYINNNNTNKNFNIINNHDNPCEINIDNNNKIENFFNKNFSNKNFNNRINNIFEKPNNKNNINNSNNINNKNCSSKNFNNINNIDNFSKNLNDINNTDNISKDLNNICKEFYQKQITNNKF